jgi:hypothetical protein
MTLTHLRHFQPQTPQDSPEPRVREKAWDLVPCLAAKKSTTKWFYPTTPDFYGLTSQQAAMAMNASLTIIQGNGVGSDLVFMRVLVDLNRGGIVLARWVARTPRI